MPPGNGPEDWAKLRYVKAGGIGGNQSRFSCPGVHCRKTGVGYEPVHGLGYFDRIELLLCKLRRRRDRPKTSRRSEADNQPVHKSTRGWSRTGCNTRVVIQGCEFLCGERSVEWFSGSKWYKRDKSKLG